MKFDPIHFDKPQSRINLSAREFLLNASFIFLIVIVGCKQEPLPPPIYNPPVAKGQLLSYYNDVPIADATIKLYYSNDALLNPDHIDTTDQNGYFTYKNLKDTIANAIPSKAGWWCPFEYGYTLNNLGDAEQNDSIIYLFKQANVKVRAHIKTRIELPFTGNFKVSDMVVLPKIAALGYWPADEWFGTASDTGIYKIELDAMGGMNNTVWLSLEQYSNFNGSLSYTVVDSISFYADTSGNKPQVDISY